MYSPGYKCKLCKEQFKEENDIVKELQCNDVFHAQCIDLHLLKNKTCPSCGQKVLY